MKEFRRLTIAVPAVVLVVCLVAIYLTQGSMANLPFLRGTGRTGTRGSVDGLVDQRPWQTIEALAPLATSAEEKRLARDAERLADHEVDQAFAQALRQASVGTHNLTGEALALQQKVAMLQGMVKSDQAKVDSLTAAAKGVNPPGTDDLDIAKAQLQLDNDELADANEDLARASGDNRGQIQQELTAREATMKKFDEQADNGAPTAIQSAKRHGTLAGRVSAWFDQRTRIGLIEQAQAEADADVAALTAQHGETEKQLSAAGSANQAQGDGQGRVARLAQMHTLAQIHGILDDRIATQKQLSAVYGRWLDQVKLQHKIVVHLMLQSVAWIAFLGLCGALVAAGANKLLDRLTIDRRSLHTLRTVTNLGIQLLMLLLILLVIFGAPSQIPTILGLMTAGLTVVFQDFILAFFGWFVLMGKNGIRVGDWVEINGVGGEVVEVGLFRTSLLETGNWTDKGHPTGRRVTFINNFAVTGQYFNFTTSGQWMWDEISVNIPSGPDTYRTIEAIHTAVEKETANDTKQAEEEWKKAAKQNVLSSFTAKPSVDMRPSAAGVDVLVRYVTHASERFEMRNRIYQSVINLLHGPEAEGGATVSDGVKS
ncbi:small-conductance mechanosensitive channel [Edaphobacter aggregans]|uniref:Small-conductance mechanosensitive channel n=1 Tax=Edaphobacter aggregans TaxID=570835 RepID=A0A428MKZ6_9BACT|nr:mechanosensitive ion channel family protein [Edaphobacter aggregans]RSL17527.1 small-conductance mechanosensitive channel [Edaphobacter aggregans]